MAQKLCKSVEEIARQYDDRESLTLCFMRNGYERLEKRRRWETLNSGERIEYEKRHVEVKRAALRAVIEAEVGWMSLSTEQTGKNFRNVEVSESNV